MARISSKKPATGLASRLADYVSRYGARPSKSTALGKEVGREAPGLVNGYAWEDLPILHSSSLKSAEI